MSSFMSQVADIQSSKSRRGAKKSRYYRASRAIEEAIGLKLEPKQRAIAMAALFDRDNPGEIFRHNVRSAATERLQETNGVWFSEHKSEFEMMVKKAYGDYYKEVQAIVDGTVQPTELNVVYPTDEEINAKTYPSDCIVRAYETPITDPDQVEVIIENHSEWLAANPKPSEFTYTYTRPAK